MIVKNVDEFVKGYIENFYDFNLVVFSDESLYGDLLKLSESNCNNAVYQSILGYIYLNGHHNNNEVITPDYDKAFDWFCKALSNDIPVAYYEIGKMYETGIGRDKNIILAGTFYLQAASRKCPQALIRLGDWYFNGISYNQDYKKAFNLYKEAYELHYLGAIQKLILCYTGGYGVDADSDEFGKLLVEGFKREDLFCIYFMAGLNLEGKMGVPKDIETAFEQYYLTANYGYVDSMIKLALLFSDGTVVEQDYEEAKYWFNTAASKGNTFAMVNLSSMYFGGKGTPVDIQSGIKWLKYAAKLNNATAMHRLGTIYEDGKLVKKDLKLAFDYYTNAVKLGNVDSMILVSKFYLNGIIVDKNIEYGIKLLEQASANNSNHAMLILGECYYDGKYVIKNISKSFDYYKKAMDLGNIEAMVRVSLFYIDGEVVNENIEHGLNLLKKASDEGSLTALNLLGDLYSDDSYDFYNLYKARSYYKSSMEHGDEYGKEEYIKINEVTEEMDACKNNILKEIGSINENYASYQLQRIADKGYIPQPEYEYNKSYDDKGNIVWNVWCDVEPYILNGSSIICTAYDYNTAKNLAAYGVLQELLNDELD